MSITVVLAIVANGRKLPPLLVWKDKERAVLEKIGGVLFRRQLRLWVDSKLLSRWTDHAYPLVDGGAGNHIV